MTTINEYAFKGCKSLECIILYTISYLGKGAFENCESLYKCWVLVPIITKIESYTFKNCLKLSDLIIKATLFSISEDAFYKCPISIQLNTFLNI